MGDNSVDICLDWTSELNNWDDCLTPGGWWLDSYSRTAPQLTLGPVHPNMDPLAVVVRGESSLRTHLDHSEVSPPTLFNQGTSIEFLKEEWEYISHPFSQPGCGSDTQVRPWLLQFPESY